MLILLVLGVRGCLNARSHRAMKDYVRNVAALVQESDQESKSLFDLLSSKGGRDQAVTIENNLNNLRLQSEQLVDRARGADVPDEMQQAQRYLLETLEFRRDGLAAIADALPTAIGDQDRRRGTERVAAQMQNFLASDVIYTQRTVPSMESPLRKESLLDEVQVPRQSRFLPDISWLDPRTVADRVAGIRTGRGGRAASPGLHGDGLGTVNLGGQTLTPGGSATIKLTPSPQFQIQVLDQGQNTETAVPVRVTIGRGADAIKLEKSIDTIAAGETKTVAIPLTNEPPTGQNVPIVVEVDPVPGETKTDNNKGTFSAIFTR